MRPIITAALAFVVTLACSAMIYLILDSLSREPRMIKQDCSLASFHPDVPTEVRKECRRMRA